MTPTEIHERANALIEKYGPWRSGVKLSDNIYVGPDSPRTDIRAQAYWDVARTTVGLRKPSVLDLGALCGSLYVPFAERDCSVTAVEGREGNCAKMALMNECRNFHDVVVVQGKMPESLTVPQVQREFDVVLFCGLMYHLPVEIQAKVMELAALVWKPKLMVIDTWLADVKDKNKQAVNVAICGQPLVLRYVRSEQPHSPTANINASDDGLFTGRDQVTEPSLQLMLKAIGVTVVLNHSVIWDWVPEALNKPRHAPGTRKVFFAYWG